MTNPYTAPWWAEDPEEEQDDRLPNGFRRSEYHEYGISDDDIDLWGLDQPGAPAPSAAGWVVWDLLDGVA
jgi:hypothetical protein